MARVVRIVGIRIIGVLIFIAFSAVVLNPFPRTLVPDGPREFAGIYGECIISIDMMIIGI
jgi:hypothetical protein